MSTDIGFTWFQRASFGDAVEALQEDLAKHGTMAKQIIHLDVTSVPHMSARGGGGRDFYAIAWTRRLDMGGD